MLSPEDIVRKAKKREAQNLRFRSWLKFHADEDELDARFKALHEKIFATYDCRECGNCCRMYQTTVQPSEIERIADCLGIDVLDFRNEFLLHNNNGYVFNAPCPMLQENGECRIQEVKPEECKCFPYTNRPGRMESLYGMMEYAGICPVVHEIIERLSRCMDSVRHNAGK